MTDQDLFYLLALLKVDGVGDIMAKKLLSHFGNAEAILKAN
jgi:DNA processing protein